MLQQLLIKYTSGVHWFQDSRCKSMGAVRNQPSLRTPRLPQLRVLGTARAHKQFKLKCNWLWRCCYEHFSVYKCNDIEETVHGPPLALPTVKAPVVIAGAPTVKVEAVMSGGGGSSRGIGIFNNNHYVTMLDLCCRRSLQFSQKSLTHFSTENAMKTDSSSGFG